MKKRAPKWAPFALVAGGACLGLLAGWVLLLSPKQHHIADLHTQAAAVQQQISADLARAATARTATSAPTIRVADIYKLQMAMPSTTDVPDLLLELDQTASAAGVQITSLQPGQGSASSSGDYTVVPVTLTVSGNFYSLTDLLYRLRNLVYVHSGALEANGRIFSVSSVALSPVGKVVNAQITLDTYVYGTAAAGSSSSTAAPAPTSTDTTTTTTTTTDSSGPAAAGATP